MFCLDTILYGRHATGDSCREMNILYVGETSMVGGYAEDGMTTAKIKMRHRAKGKQSH